jgi:hypothetical protein
MINRSVVPSHEGRVQGFAVREQINISGVLVGRARETASE